MSQRRARVLALHMGGSTIPDRELLTRFLEDRDEAAFAELVRRHAGLVRNAANRVVSEPADADDVCQGTFLVLIRRARSMSWRAELGPWLYGVAHRIAVRLRDRNRRTPNPLGDTEPPDRTSTPDPSWREACQAVHAELDRLPDCYRMPLFLCYLEGQTRDEAAVALGLSVGTVKGRVQRGCEMLRRRLERRGVSLTAALLSAIALPGTTAVSAASTNLAMSVLGTPSPRAIQLAKEMTVGMTIWKLMACLAMTLAVGAIAIAAAVVSDDRTPAAPTHQPIAVVPPVPAPPAKIPAATAPFAPDVVFTKQDDDGLGAVTFADGKVVVTGGSMVRGPGNGQVRFRDAATGKVTGSIPLPHGVEAVAISPDGKTLAVGTGGILQGPRAKPYKVEPGKLAIITIPEGKQVFELKAGSHTYASVAFNADGTLLAAGGGPANEKGLPVEASPIVVWEAATGKEKVRFAGQPGYVRGGAFSPDGKTLAAVSQVPRERPGQLGSGHARLWDVTTGKEIMALTAHTGPIWGVAFSPDGKLVATGGEDGTVRVWDPNTGKELSVLKFEPAKVMSVAFSADGKWLAAGGGDPGDGDAKGVLRVWDAATRKEATDLPGHERTVMAVAFSPDSTRLAAAEARGTLKVWALSGK